MLPCKNETSHQVNQFLTIFSTNFLLLFVFSSRISRLAEHRSLLIPLNF